MHFLSGNGFTSLSQSEYCPVLSFVLCASNYMYIVYPMVYFVLCASNYMYIVYPMVSFVLCASNYMYIVYPMVYFVLCASNLNVIFNLFLTDSSFTV